MGQARPKIVDERDELFDPDRLAMLDKACIPRHIAMIMDGNRRWAKLKQLPSLAGHGEGVRALFRTVKGANLLGVKTLTVFGFSTENWRRSDREVGHLMQVIEQAIFHYEREMDREGVSFHTIGDLSCFPTQLQDELHALEQRTAQREGLDLVVALGYGARDEIRRGVVQLVDDVVAGRVDKEEITETLLGTYLDTARWDDPDLVIRTSGEMRISNFLLWQLSYAEVLCSPILWPDFGPNPLLDTLLEYQRRERRHGR